MLTMQVLLDLASLSDVILTEYEQLVAQPIRDNTAAMVPTTTTFVPTDVCGTIISPKLENDENAVPFTTMTTSTIISENYPKYFD